jgi:hypothetical protein
MKISSFAPSVVTASAPRTTASSAPSPASQARSGVLTVGNTVSEPAEFLSGCMDIFGTMDEALKAISNVLGKGARAGLKNEKNRLAKSHRLTHQVTKDLYLRILTTYAGDQRFQLKLSPDENTLVRRPLGENPSKRRR